MNENQMVGVSHVARARALLARKDSKDRWPYFWLFPPASADDTIVTGGIVLPAITFSPSVYSQVLQYNVPSGMCFILTGVVAQAAVAGDLNSAFAPGDGSMLFTLDVSQPTTSAVPVGAPVKGYNNLSVPLGSFQFGPWPLSKPRLFNPLDQLRWKVTNVSLTVPSPNDIWVACGLFGYTMPADEAK